MASINAVLGSKAWNDLAAELLTARWLGDERLAEDVLSRMRALWDSAA